MDRTCSYRDPWNIARCTECNVTVDLCQCVNVANSAHERLSGPDGIVMAMVRGELIAARQQFPGSTHMLAALMEEVGELAQAMIDHDRGGSQTAIQVLREAVQVASMAVRIAVEGDDNMVYEFPMLDQGLPRTRPTPR